MPLSCFAAVDIPSFHFEDQKDLYRSDMVQGLGILSCKCPFSLPELLSLVFLHLLVILVYMTTNKRDLDIRYIF